MALMSWSVELWPGEITVNRDERQRRELSDIDSLAASIKLRGQLQPIVITRDHVLVAGERRYTAIAKLEDRPIRCVYVEELDPTELRAIELEENMKRLDLDWRDRCKAILEYHEFKLKTSKDWSQADTAKMLILSDRTISQHIAVARELLAGNQMIIDSPKFSTARGIVERKNMRQADTETTQLLAMASAKPKSTPVIVAPGETVFARELSETEIDPDLEILADIESSKTTGYVLNEDFRFWAENYSGPKFNLIHCDFPYGINMQRSDQSSGDSHGTYEDTPEVYWALIDSLINHLDNFCTPSAHLIFWFSMEFYHETYELLSQKFKVSKFPLIWYKSDNSGILPDPNRGPRRVYETAFFASRGDRKIVRPISNLVAANLTRGRHMSEKSQEALQHFFKMVVDEHSAVLDPTCGSGSAIRAAANAGAGRFLGLEINPEFAQLADEALSDFLKEQENAKS
jgi:ParB/RepB/Spo0J family partition protein